MLVSLERNIKICHNSFPYWVNPQSIEQSMDSKEFNILGKTINRVFSSNYLTESSFIVIVIVVLFILITAAVCIKRCQHSASISRWSHGEIQPFLRSTCPDIHQTTASGILQAFPIPTPDSIVFDGLTTIQSPRRSQDVAITIEDKSRLSDISPWLANCNKHYTKIQASDACGLKNLGNLCYVNSALQCLYHTRSFVKLILNLQEQPSCPLPSITLSFRQLITQMQFIANGPASAHEIKVQIAELNRRFSGTDQQDSHEFLTVLLEALHDEWLDHYQNSSIGQLIHGIVRSTVICPICEREIKTDESFISLPLPIYGLAVSNSDVGISQKMMGNIMDFFNNSMQGSVTLHDCFENFLAREQLGTNGQWFCQKCQRLTDATKKLDFDQLPQVLILQLKRFTYNLSDNMKITTKVSFGEVLDLQEFISDHDTHQTGKYNLVAVLVHTGTLASGHYTTFARHLKRRCWYHFDDERVRPASLDEALASDAYVLFYERQN